MRSGEIRARHDSLVRELCADPRYEVRQDGTIWTNKPAKGYVHRIVEWRQIGRLDAEGYVEVKYKRTYLRAHRVVYQKFFGTLANDLVIDHINGSRADNRPENLRMVAHKTNIYYRDRRLGYAA